MLELIAKSAIITVQSARSASGEKGTMMSDFGDLKNLEDVQEIETSKFAEYAELVRQASPFSQTSIFPEFFAPKPAPLTLSFGR
ncbi:MULTISPECIES: hypothetical protein [Arthrobacter]|uniref:Uncharacterized protein n=1 Tax=Arthrobacter terricola TaxID=2547396 RepID=A0A4R5KAZ5_9MICC|nr:MULTISPECIES: hypothetical protein [Arthrobacter]MBT8162777.1 hypothetical protein [Arthrobacter sp. GN70]TDF92062.1 hypothetical protein E1809_18960 [Arthrobacter terricola]